MLLAPRAARGFLGLTLPPVSPSGHRLPLGLPGGPRVRATTLATALRLYERDRREPCGSSRLDAFVRRWCGLGGGVRLRTGNAKVRRSLKDQLATRFDLSARQRRDANELYVR